MTLELSSWHCRGKPLHRNTLVLIISLSALGLALSASFTEAQTLPSPSVPRDRPPESPLPQQLEPPSNQRPPLQLPSVLPQPIEEQRKPPTIRSKPECTIRVPPTSQQPRPATERDSDLFTVNEFLVIGSTAFNCEQLTEALKRKALLRSPLSFPELFQARSAITELYTEPKPSGDPNDRYITSGAYLPKQELTSGTVKIQVVEGIVENIQVANMQRLNPNYVRSRLQLGTAPPLNQKKLLNALRLLQADPLIDSISAELRAGVSPGTSILEVQVIEAPTWRGRLFTDNGRSPSVGSFRRGVGLTQANLLGLGDGLSVGYNNTDGSNGLDLSYTLPLNPRNGTLNFSYGRTLSNIVEEPLSKFDIDSNSRYYQLTFRQPVIQTPNREFALSLIGSVNENRTSIEGTDTKISPGADSQGFTRASAIRFAQEYVLQNRSSVFAARSQFSLGIDAFGATINDTEADSRFFSWRGQLQWVRLFGLYEDDLPTAPTLLTRAEVQLADRPLLPTEQFGFGGLGSVRGYRQDAVLTDNGLFASAELPLPLLRIKKWNSLVQSDSVC